MNQPPGYKKRLETTIAEQNVLIQSLQENLEYEQSKLKNLTAELYSLRDDSKIEINSLKDELEKEKNTCEKFKDELTNLKTELDNERSSSELVKISIEEDFNLKQKQLCEELRAKYKKEIDELQLNFTEELRKAKLKESFLEKQVELLSNRIGELYERDVNHDTELEASRKIYEGELEQLQQSIRNLQEQNLASSFPDQIKFLNDKLASCLTNEVALKAELNSHMKTLDRLKEDNKNYQNQLNFNSVVEQQLKEELASALVEIDKLKAELKDTQNKMSELKEQHHNQIVKMEENHETLVSTFNGDMIHLDNAMKQLFNALSAFLRSEANLDDKSTNSELDIVSQDNIESDAYSEDMLNCLLQKIRKSYGEIEKISDRYYLLYTDNEEMYKKNETLQNQLENCSSLFKERCKILESEIAKLQSKLSAYKAENDELHKTIEEMNLTKTKETDKIKAEQELFSSKVKYLEEKQQQLINEKNGLMTKIQNLESQCRTPSPISVVRESGDCPLVENEDYMPSESFNFFKYESVDFNKHLMSTKGITSTPFPRNLMELDLQGGGEHISEIKQSESSSYIALISWMEQCQILDKENKGLIKKIESLELQIKDMELGTRTIKNEMDVFDIKRKELENEISDYSNLKKKCAELTEKNNLNELKLSSLLEQVKLLEEQNKKLMDDNIAIETKCKNYLDAYKESGETDSKGMTETVLNHFNDKLKELVLLKGELRSMVYAKNKLTEKCDKLNEVKNLYILKLEETSRELCIRNEELEDIFQDKIKICTKNKMLEKEIEVLNLRLDYLNNLRENNWGIDSSMTLTERMQKELLTLCKQAIEQKLEFENVMVDKKNSDGFQIELDARHQHQILLKNNAQLQNEKERLLETILEQQQLIHGYQKEQGVDSVWLLKVNDLENDLINEIRAHKEQHARIEEALRSTGKLHNELQLQKDSLLVKNQELAKMSKKLEEEKFKLRKSEMQIQLLQKDLEKKETELKECIENKKLLGENLKMAQTNLADAETKLKYELKNIEWKVQHSKLQDAQLEIERSLNKMSEDKEALLSDMETNAKSQFLKEAENEYERALQKIRFYYEAQYANNLSKQQEDHKIKVEKLNLIIKEQGAALKNAIGKNVIKNVLSGSEDKQWCSSYKELLDSVVRKYS